MPVFTVGEVLTAALMNQVQMKPTAKSGNYTAVDGDFVEMTGQFTVTLPAPSTAQQRIGIVSVNGTGAAPCTVSTPSGAIIGPGVAAAATSILLGAVAAYVVLISDGTNWFITAGNADSGWNQPAPTLPWGNFGGPLNPFGYRKIGCQVLVRGVMAGGSSGQAMYTLPAGFRPVNNYTTTATPNNATGMVQIDITAAGVITPVWVNTPGTFVSIDDTSFTVD